MLTTNCLPCQERRRAIMDAWQSGKIAEAVKEAAKGAAEIVGLKENKGGDRD